MTAEPNLPRNAKPPLAPQRATHLFKVGQAVRLKGGVWRSGDIYRVTATLPPVGDSPQYRIRNDGERFERVATQDNLEHALPSTGGAGASEIEKSFGHGQGT